MSQQEIQFDTPQQNEAKAYNIGYGASPHYSNEYESISFSQKIGGEEEQNERESAHLREHRLNLRIGMAITSLVLWMIFFFSSIAIILKNPTISVIRPLIVIGLGTFTVLVVLANILINRKKI